MYFHYFVKSDILRDWFPMVEVFLVLQSCLTEMEYLTAIHVQEMLINH